MYRGIPDYPEYEMRPMRAFACRASLLLALALSACLQTDPAGSEEKPGAPSRIADPIQTAGATSSTNWPPEDVGTQPVQISGIMDSVLTLTFQAPIDSTRIPMPTRISGRVFLYREGFIPVLDTVPSLGFAFPATDTLRITARDLKPLMDKGMDTLRFTVEIRTDAGMSLMPGFVYSMSQSEFLAWPPTFNAQGTVTFSDPHYMFAGIPDSAFRSALADTNENARFYYYIAGSPYHWRHASAQDSLYLGPTVKGKLPLRCLKVMPRSGMHAGYSIEAYPLTLKREFVNDSAHHAYPIDRFILGNPLFQIFLPEAPRIRTPR